MRIAGLEYDSPVQFSLRQRVALSTYTYLGAAGLKLLASTWRAEIVGANHLSHALATHGHAIVAFWHENLAVAAWAFRGTGSHTLTSYSYDGELAARFVERFGLHALRGSSSRGGLRALVSMTRAMNHVKMIGLTLDGPRGPRRESKPGVAILAAKTGVPIVPFAVAANRSWRMSSWDRFLIPKPFARVRLVYGTPIAPPVSVEAGQIEYLRRTVEERLNDLQSSIES